MKNLLTHSLLRLAVAVGVLGGLQGCASTPEAPKPVVDRPFKQAPKNNDISLVSKEDLALLEESENPLYRFGSGDRLLLHVLGRGEVSGKHVIGPDGMITVPLIGDIFLNGLTREEAQKDLDKRFREYFRSPYVTLGVEEYTSNQVTVLGRVATAGIQRFPHPPTLAEVLASASQAVAERFDHLPGQIRRAVPTLPPAVTDQVMRVIAEARNEWVRATVALVTAKVLAADDPADDGEPEVFG